MVNGVPADVCPMDIDLGDQMWIDSRFGYLKLNKHDIKVTQEGVEIGNKQNTTISFKRVEEFHRLEMFFGEHCLVAVCLLNYIQVSLEFTAQGMKIFCLKRRANKVVLILPTTMEPIHCYSTEVGRSKTNMQIRLPYLWTLNIVNSQLSRRVVA